MKQCNNSEYDFDLPIDMYRLCNYHYKNNSLMFISNQLDQHFSTWVSEAEISKLAASGINTVRIPIGPWMFKSFSFPP